MSESATMLSILTFARRGGPEHKPRGKGAELEPVLVKRRKKRKELTMVLSEKPKRNGGRI